MRAQSCLILFDPRDYSPPASSIHGISQVRTLEWLPFPSPGHLHHPGIEPRSPALQVNSLPSEPPEDGDTKVKKKKKFLPSYFTSKWGKLYTNCRKGSRYITCDSVFSFKWISFYACYSII